MVARRSTAWRVSYRPTPREKARALRLPSAEWRRYLGDPRMQASYHARVCRAAGCWFWTGALSESGNARLRLPAHLGTRVVASHVYGYQLVYAALAMDAYGIPLITHRRAHPTRHRPRH